MEYFLIYVDNQKRHPGIPADLGGVVYNEYIKPDALLRMRDKMSPDDYDNLLYWEHNLKFGALPRPLPEELWLISPNRLLNFDYYRDSDFFLSTEFLEIVKSLDNTTFVSIKLHSVNTQGKKNSSKELWFSKCTKYSDVMRRNGLEIAERSLLEKGTKIPLSDLLDFSLAKSQGHHLFIPSDLIYNEPVCISKDLKDELEAFGIPGISFANIDRLSFQNFEVIGDEIWEVPIRIIYESDDFGDQLVW